MQFKGYVHLRDNAAMPWSPVVLAECEGPTGLDEVRRAVLEGLREHAQPLGPCARELWASVYVLPPGGASWNLIGRRKMVGTVVKENWQL